MFINSVKDRMDHQNPHLAHNCKHLAGKTKVLYLFRVNLKPKYEMVLRARAFPNYHLF